MAFLLARLVARDVARPLGARLGPVNLALLFGVVQFATVIPWPAVRAWIVAEPAAASYAGVGLLALWQLSWGRLLRRHLVDSPTLAPAWRTAPSALARGLALAPVLVAVAAPALLPSLLWPGAGVLPGRVGLAVVLGALALSWPTTPLLGLVAAAAAAAEPVMPTWPVLGVAPVVVGAVHAWCLRPRPLPRPPAPWSLPAPRGKLGALLWLDATALARCAPDVAPSALLAAVPTAGLLLGIRRHDAPAGTLAVSAAVLACITAPLGGVALSRLRAILGDTFFVRRWPAAPALRAASLFFLAVGVFAPTGFAMGATLASAAPPYVVAPLGPTWLAAAACAAGAVALAPRRSFAHGLHLGWITGVLGLVLWDCELGRGAQALAAVAALGVGWLRLGRRPPRGLGGSGQSDDLRSVGRR